MKILKNRTVLGVICIALALVICFVITPLFNASASHTTDIVRIKKDVKIGQQLTDKDIEVVTVGSYNLPNEVLHKSDEVVGKYASHEMLVGEYVLSTKISDTPASENAYLYNLTGEKRAISIKIQSFAKGLSGKLISGDIVSIIAVDYKEQGETVVPDELQYVEVIAVTDDDGNDEKTTTVNAAGDEETDLPETVTLLVTQHQANLLAQIEAEGEMHIALVYRGLPENAKKFIDAQQKLLDELAAKKAEEKEAEKKNENSAENGKTESENGAASDAENSGEAAAAEETSDGTPSIEQVIVDNNEETEVNADVESV